MKDYKKRVLDQINEKEIIEFMQDLIRIKSVNPPGKEESIARFIKNKLMEEGICTYLDEVDIKRPNVIAELGKAEGPVLLYNAHMDTVPVGNANNWKYNPFGGEIDNGKIYGRGASDDKGGVAAMVMAAIAIKRAGVPLNGKLLVTSVMGEETGNIGTKHLLDKGIKADWAIVGEYSDATKIGLGYRGSLWLNIKIFGKTAHGSRPYQGINAINLMTKWVLPAIREINLDFTAHELFPAPTVNIATINGGVKTNVVPDYCESTIDIRLVPGQCPEDVFKRIKSFLNSIQDINKDFSFELDKIQATKGFVTDKECPMVRILAEVIEDISCVKPQYIGKTGGSDANILVIDGKIPSVAYGPGNSSGHSPDENISIDNLILSTKVYALTALKLLL